MRSLILTILFSVLPLGVEAAEDIRDVKPPVAYPAGLWFWMALGSLGVAAVAAGTWLFLRNRRQRPAPIVPVAPPWVIARQRLDRLKGLNLPAQGELKAYFSELSDIVRRYIEDRFSIKAPEMTTEEFLISLKASGTLNAAQKQALANFMTCSDMVKFAKYAANLSEVEESLSLAWRLVEETKGPDVDIGKGAS